MRKENKVSSIYQALDQLESEREELVVPAGATSLDFLQAIYRNPTQSTSRRMRAAIAALPFEHPKLAVTATLGDVESFAARLEAARQRAAKVVTFREGELSPEILERSGDSSV